MTDIGELVVRIKADSAQLERELRKAQAVVQGSADSMTGYLKDLKAQFAALVPAISAVAIVGLGRAAFAEADHINDLALRVGFLRTTLSALDVPLKQSGSNLDEFAGSIVRMNNMVGEAVKGGQDQVKTFDELGLSVRKLAQLSPEEQFYAISQALAQIKDQSQFTNIGISIFGRSFASIAPLIRESKGNLADFVAKAQELGLTLTEDQFNKIDELGDRWTAALESMKKQLLQVIPLVEGLAKAPDYIKAAFVEIPYQAGQIIGRNISGNQQPNGPTVVLGNEPYGPFAKSPNAKGNNTGLIKNNEAENARKALQAYNLELQQQNQILHQTPREQAAMEAAFKSMELAQKAGITLTDEQIQANMDLAKANYDLAQSMQEAARFQQELHDKLSSSLADIAFSFNSAADSAKNFALSIAKAAFERKIAGPIADSLIGTGGGKGILDNLFGGFFAAGGSPPVGKPSVVGENGPEIFMPNTAGTIIPNGKLGGTTVVVQQTINMQPGLTETVGAAIRQAAPVIAAQAHASVFTALQKGGSESRIAGLRG